MSNILKIDISVIIPVFNEAERIARCLESIRNQNYSQNRIEIILIDDFSTDQTLKIAKKYHVKVYKNGSHNIEKGKSIGLEHAGGEFVFFIDADNYLTSRDWFQNASLILKKNSKVVGVQSYKYLYKSSDPIVNRYCALFGINDPLVFYLGKRGQLQAYENSWIYPETLLKENKLFYLAKFNSDNLPTVGSQGYLTRKNLLSKTDWKPYLFHLDSAHDLVSQDKNTFAFIKYEIGHDYVTSIGDLIKKWQRNINLYYKYAELRRYKYQIDKLKLILILLMMITIVGPLIDSLKGFIKKRDLAWFLHPLLCLIVVFIYGKETIKALNYKSN